MHTPYPATLAIDYPYRELDRLTTALRPVLIVPIAIVLGLVSGPTAHAGQQVVIEAGGMVWAATVLMLVFRQKYPRWWYDWNVALTKFGLRVAAYAALMRDEYPSTDEEQAVHAEVPYPDARQLNRWLPLVKWFLAIPHYFVLVALYLGAAFGVIYAWFVILFAGTYPRAVFEYVTGVMRWSLRVCAYAFLLTTDRYPPFRLSA
jgi:hypothetical protein